MTNYAECAPNCAALTVTLQVKAILSGLPRAAASRVPTSPPREPWLVVHSL